jgi:hypothetical protein
MRYSKEDKEWYRYLHDIITLEGHSSEDKEEAAKLLREVPNLDHHVFSESPSEREFWR